MRRSNARCNNGGCESGWRHSNNDEDNEDDDNEEDDNEDDDGNDDDADDEAEFFGFSCATIFRMTVEFSSQHTNNRINGRNKWMERRVKSDGTETLDDANKRR